MINYKKKTLNNGLKAIVAPRQDTKSITLLVLVKVGSRYENAEINGVSHFVEHLMFKGTRRRPSTLLISKELDGVGAEYNAFTSKDHTGYYVKINSDKAVLAFDILSDMLTDSLFDEKEINRERGVIEEEINMYQDNPQMHIESLLEELTFGNYTCLGHDVAGPKKVIQTITRKSIVGYKNKYYYPGNMLVAIAGNIGYSRGFGMIKKYFNYSKNNVKPHKFQKARINQNKPRVKLEFKKTEQAQLCIGFPSYSYFHKDWEALYLLKVILGGNMSSRLFINIRERLGLCYFIRSYMNTYEDTGSFIVQAGLDRRRIGEAVTKILEEIGKIKNEPVTQSELSKAKEHLKGRFTLEMEDSEHVAEWYASQQLLTGKTKTLEERLEKINKVSAADIAKVAGDLFKTAKLNLAVIGPFKNKNDFKKLLKI